MPSFCTSGVRAPKCLSVYQILPLFRPARRNRSRALTHVVDSGLARRSAKVPRGISAPKRKKHHENVSPVLPASPPTASKAIGKKRARQGEDAESPRQQQLQQSQQQQQQSQQQQQQQGALHRLGRGREQKRFRSSRSSTYHGGKACVD